MQCIYKFKSMRNPHSWICRSYGKFPARISKWW